MGRDETEIAGHLSRNLGQTGVERDTGYNHTPRTVQAARGVFLSAGRFARIVCRLFTEYTLTNRNAKIRLKTVHLQ